LLVAVLGLGGFEGAVGENALSIDSRALLAVQELAEAKGLRRPLVVVSTEHVCLVYPVLLLLQHNGGWSLVGSARFLKIRPCARHQLLLGLLKLVWSGSLSSS
jgi:hypothetical protein